ncbi:MAG: acyltransferase domain-containing protein [Chloroflexi bacterium]|nr:acyltransferase domain-containing protein [Chloroflexota bacterium]
MAERADNLSPLKQAIVEIRELRAQLAQRDEVEQARTEPIAIVGLSLRFPGGAQAAESFWQLLRDGVDTIAEVPAERWDIDAYYDANSTTPGKMSTRFGAWLNGIDQFDAPFFGISPREAMSMDPQQRLLLEVTWEALEQAGQSPERLAGSDTGVFLGLANSDYGRLLFTDPAKIDTYASTGSAFSVTAGRLSYWLGLHGPNMALDTACSSSLVAVHLAAQSLRRGECQLALVGGVNLILTPEVNINFSKANMLSTDGRCKTFDARADGYVRGEGCAVIVLKKLPDAIANHDRVLAIVRGSAINHDGRSGGLTAPNGPAQEAVIRAALKDANVEAAQVSYVEAHGTGTSLGDPIEVRALGGVYGRDRSTPLLIGSVKTNIGHVEAAAGLAGLIKVVLMLQHREIAPQLHFQQRNPYVEWDQWPLIVATQHAPWQADRRIAGVSSFGFSGTNAHVIVEEAPGAPPIEAAIDRPVQVLTLSAKSAAALKSQAAQFERHLQHSTDSFADVCFTANTGRSHFAHRLAVIASTPDEARERLTAFMTGRDNVNVFNGHRLDANPPAVAFLFTGYGSQYADMGRQLYDTQPTFRAAIDRCDAIFQSQTGESLKKLLYSQSAINNPTLLRSGDYSQQSTITQPAVFALEYALAELWQSWGVEPAIVAGHSLGEYAAACVAGVFSLADGLKLVAARDRLMRAVPEVGEMVTVFADEATVAATLAAQPEVAIAAINSPETVVISGRSAAVHAVLAELQARKIRSRRLPIAYASHSPLIEPILDEFERIASEVEYSRPHTALMSSVTGEMIDGAEVADAKYWRRHLRSTVRFAATMDTLDQQGYRVFVEIGPAPTLLSLGQRCVREPAASQWLPSLREGQADWAQLLETLSALYVHGARIDWVGFERDYVAARQRVSLPTYPFEHKAYWWTEDRAQRVIPAATTSQRWADVIDAGRRQAQQAPLDLALNTYAEKQRCLSELTIGYVYNALGALGAFAQAGEEQSIDSLLARCNIAPTYRNLMGRWLNKLVDARRLERRSDGVYVAAQPFAQRSLEATWVEAQAALADVPFLIDYVRRCGEALPGVLTGQISALETLFPDGSFATTEALYQDWAQARYFNNVVRAVVEAAARSGDRLRVIELGAGTGSTTSAVLPALSRDRTTYTFTDVSDLFLDRAREKFAAYPFVRYGLLNIEQDPAAQGYARHGYDVVIAANVLHATHNVDETLQHVQSLLAAQGVLVLYEATRQISWYDITTGLIEGWQRFDDDVRSAQDYPLLSPAQWAQVLRAAGFTDVVSWPEAGSAADVLGLHVIVARPPQSNGTVEGEAPIEQVETDRAVPIQSAGQAPSIDLLNQLQAALPDERHDILIGFVRQHVVRILRLDPNEPLDRRARLMDIGVDSLMAVELRSRLSGGLGLAQNLPATLIFDYPTIEAIARYLLYDLLALADGSAAPTEPVASSYGEAGPSSTVDELEQMSDEEVTALLMKKLRSRT